MSGGHTDGGDAYGGRSGMDGTGSFGLGGYLMALGAPESGEAG
jgi:hypothetical protein